MAESSPEGEGNKFSRRDLFTKVLPKATAVAATALGAGAIAQNEVRKYQEGGIDTPSGFFTGIYDVHLFEKLTKKKIPTGTDAFFREISTPMDRIIQQPESYLLSTSRWNTERILSDEVLIDLADKQIPIILGDIDIDPKRLVLEQGAIPFGELIAAKVLIELRKRQKATATTRRKILKAGATIAATFGIAGAANTVMQLGASASQNEAAARILSSIGNLGSKLHPESEGVFLRSALIADKLLTVAEYMKSKTGKKPHIAFSVGRAHTEIEDFLQAGPDICRTVITTVMAAYPDFISKDLIERNGGTKAFASALVYQLPNTLDSQDLHTSDKTLPKLEGQSEVITDKKLEDMLNR